MDSIRDIIRIEMKLNLGKVAINVTFVAFRWYWYNPNSRISRTLEYYVTDSKAIHHLALMIQGTHFMIFVAQIHSECYSSHGCSPNIDVVNCTLKIRVRIIEPHRPEGNSLLILTSLWGQAFLRGLKYRVQGTECLVLSCLSSLRRCAFARNKMK